MSLRLNLISLLPSRANIQVRDHSVMAEPFGHANHLLGTDPVIGSRMNDVTQYPDTTASSVDDRSVHTLREISDQLDTAARQLEMALRPTSPDLQRLLERMCRQVDRLRALTTEIEARHRLGERDPAP